MIRVVKGKSETTRRGHPKKKRPSPVPIVKLILPLKGVDGVTFLTAMGDWMQKAGAVGSYNWLHQPQYRAVIVAAFASVDTPLQLFADVIVKASEWHDEVERKTIIARAHGVVAALANTDYAYLASPQRPAPYRGPAHAVRHWDALKDMSAALSAGVSVLSKRAQSVVDLKTAATAGEEDAICLCKLYTSALPVFRQQPQLPADVGCALAVALEARPSVFQSIALLTALAQDEALEHVTNQHTLALVAFAADLAIYIAEAPLPPTASQQAELAELLHWLVRGGNLPCAARLANATGLCATMVHELVACQNRKMACRYVAKFNLEDEFPYLVRKGCGKDNIDVHSKSKRNHHLPGARLPAGVVVVDVNTAIGVMECVRMIVDSAAKERAAGRCGLVAIDAEVRTTSDATDHTFCSQYCS